MFNLSLNKIIVCLFPFIFGKNLNISNHIPVLCYHRVLPSFDRSNPPFSLVSPRQFESQMAFLAENGFRSLTLDEYGEIEKRGYSGTDRYVLVTFDDGYEDTYRIAWPIAKRYGIGINLFISTSIVGKDCPILMCPETPAIREHIQKFPELWRPLSWHELRIMREAGVGIGLHGHSHRNMANMDLDELTREMSMAIKTFESELGFRPQALSLPYGGPGTYTRQVLRMLKGLNLELIFSTITGRAALPCKRLPISRIVVHQNDTLPIFQKKLFGAFDWVGSVRRREQSLRELLTHFRRTR